MRLNCSRSHYVTAVHEECALFFQEVGAEWYRSMRVAPHLVLARVRRQPVLLMRYRAFKRLRDEGRSLPAIGRAAERHHTTVMAALERLPELEAKFAARNDLA